MPTARHYRPEDVPGVVGPAVRLPDVPKARVRKPVALAGYSRSVSVTLPLVTRSEANLRSWRARSRRTKDAMMAWCICIKNSPKALDLYPPLLVELVRLGGNGLDDDNLRSALKSVRDAVARWIGLDDADPQLKFDYGQEPGGPYGVRVTVSLSPSA